MTANQDARSAKSAETRGVFRKRPVEIEAVQFTGRNDAEIAAFVGSNGYDPVTRGPSWVIHTLEGDMEAQSGDWIIKGVAGEFYPCKPDIFAQTYEFVRPNTQEAA